MRYPPALLQALHSVHLAASAAPPRGKGAVYAAACTQLDLSPATLHRYLKETIVKTPRKRRSDAGETALGLEQAQRLSAVLMEAYRANNKKISSIALALTRLRKNHPGFAQWVDPATGEVRNLSDSACARALRHYGLHPEQLRQLSPAQPQRSLYPNDVWQIDASISTLFYVPEDGLADMGPDVFYKNKPENFERIKRQRLTRIVITDHCSGAIFVHYVPGGESVANMADAFLRAMQPRPRQMLHGVPFHLCMDPGSGFAGAFKNLLQRLEIVPIINKAGNPRAKGQVENAHNLVECDFESGFKYTAAPSIDWINAQAQDWMVSYNSTQVLERHGLVRYAKWMQITQEQLRLVDPAVARILLTQDHKTPKVDGELCVRFAGKRWSVRTVPDVMIGETLKVTYNPFNPACAYVLDADADGHELLIEIPEVLTDEHGFSEDAALIGREMKSQPDTRADTNRKLVERLATGTDTDEAAAAARKARTLPFAGALKPYAHHADVPDAVLLPRRGVALSANLSVAKAPARVFNVFEAAAELTRRGLVMTPELRAAIPANVTEDDLDAIAAQHAVRSGLRVVNGGVV